MISLWDAVSLLFGDQDDEPRRALFIGAGFAKAAAPWSPLFADYKAPLTRLLASAGDVEGSEAARWADVTDIIERVDRHLGRVALARTILAEPIGPFSLFEPQDALARPLPPEQPRTYPTLAEWRQLIVQHSPTHLEPLGPNAPNVLLGRLVAEGAFDELLSTNWDALIELGVMLAGVRVEDADEPARPERPWYTRLPQRMRVFESQDEIVTHWPVHGATALYKLHGGVRTLYRILSEGPTAERDRALRRSFMLSASDLVRWTGSSQWVEERVASTLRSCATLFVGVSGADTVTYEATRKQVQGWEQSTRRVHHERGQHLPLRMALVNYTASLRAQNMMTAELPDGRLLENICESDGVLAAHALYVRWFFRLMQKAGFDQEPRFNRLMNTCAAELNRPKNTPPGPATLMVCQSLGFGARFTAAALGLGAFATQHPECQPFRRWWYAPWSDAPTAPLHECLSQTIAVLDLVLAAPECVEVDPWTGVAHLSAEHPESKRHQAPDSQSEKQPLLQAGVSLLLLPCPWTDAMDWSSDALAFELSGERFAWGTGRHVDGLAMPDLMLIPLGGGDATPGSWPLTVAGHPVRWIWGSKND